jgi:hypothetical protein
MDRRATREEFLDYCRLDTQAVVWIVEKRRSCFRCSVTGVRSGECGNRKCVPSHEIRYLQPKKAPQKCLMDFRVAT